MNKDPYFQEIREKMQRQGERITTHQQDVKSYQTVSGSQA